MERDDLGRGEWTKEGVGDLGGAMYGGRGASNWMEGVVTWLLGGGSRGVYCVG